MMAIDRILKALQDKQAAYAKEVLLTPRGETGFQYGVAVGTMRGYEESILEIIAVISEKEDNEPTESSLQRSIGKPRIPRTPEE